MVFLGLRGRGGLGRAFGASRLGRGRTSRGSGGRGRSRRVSSFLGPLWSRRRTNGGRSRPRSASGGLGTLERVLGVILALGLLKADFGLERLAVEFLHVGQADDPGGVTDSRQLLVGNLLRDRVLVLDVQTVPDLAAFERAVENGQLESDAFAVAFGRGFDLGVGEGDEIVSCGKGF